MSTKKAEMTTAPTAQQPNRLQRMTARAYRLTSAMSTLEVCIEQVGGGVVGGGAGSCTRDRRTASRPRPCRWNRADPLDGRPTIHTVHRWLPCPGSRSLPGQVGNGELADHAGKRSSRQEVLTAAMARRVSSPTTSAK